MDLDGFNVAVHGVKAGQFLREKAASASVSAIDTALQARNEQAEDQDLFKIATQLCPEDALGFYVKLGGKLKLSPDLAELKALEEAEAPPPGMSAATKARVLKADWSRVARNEKDGLQKQAEPPPPAGVSMKDWDRILNQPKSG